MTTDPDRHPSTDDAPTDPDRHPSTDDAPTDPTGDAPRGELASGSRPDTTDTSIAGLSRLVRHPLVIGIVALMTAAVIFRFGVGIGEAAYSAFEGDARSAATFGVVIVATLTLLIGLGVWLDRRRARAGAGRDRSSSPPTR